MPHPPAVQIAYGSAAVVLSTFVLLLLTPGDSSVVAALVAAASLVLGVAVVMALQVRQGLRRSPADAPRAAAESRPAPRGAFPSATTAPSRPGVRV